MQLSLIALLYLCPTQRQINIALDAQSQAYTLDRQAADQLQYTVNITLAASASPAQVNAPDLSLLTAQLANCRQSVLNTSATTSFARAQTFHLDLCGSHAPTDEDPLFKLLANALLKAWLQSRPEFTFCAQSRNCLKIDILNTEKSKGIFMRLRCILCTKLRC